MENLIDMVGFNELYAPQSKAYGVIRMALLNSAVDKHSF